MSGDMLFGMILGLIIALIVFGGLYIRNIERDNDDMRKDITNLIADNSKLVDRVTELEAVEAKRLPHDAAAALEDLISAQMNQTRLMNEAKLEYEAALFWGEKIAEFARCARGAKGYDPDAPSGNVRRA